MRLGLSRLRIAKDGDWPVLAAIGRENGGLGLATRRFAAVISAAGVDKVGEGCDGTRGESEGGGGGDYISARRADVSPPEGVAGLWDLPPARSRSGGSRWLVLRRPCPVGRCSTR